MNKIWIDCNSLMTQKPTGIAQYGLQLLTQLVQLKNHPEFSYKIAGYYKLSRIKKAKLMQQLFASHAPRLQTDLQVHAQWPWLLGACTKENPSLVHGLDFRVPVKKNIKKVVTVHDLAEFEDEYHSPEFTKKAKADMNHMLNVCQPDHIITVSDFSQRELIRHFPETRDKITTVHLGCDHLVKKNKGLPVVEKYKVPTILCVGTLEKRKNQINLVRAFNLLKKQHPASRLIIVGGYGFEGEKVMEQVESSPFKKDIEHVNYAGNEKLMELYQKSHLFVLPSLYEGFGIPILEAMSYGLPVLVHNDGATKEVAEPAGLLCDMRKPEDMAQSILKIILDSDLENEMKALSLNHVSQFTWAQTARKTLKVYQNTLGLK